MNFKCILGGIVAFGMLSGVVLADEEAEDEALAERLAPVGRLCLQGQECQRAVTQHTAADATEAAASDEPSLEEVAQYDGEALYAKASCGACHAAGIAGAPATGDSTAWTARLAQGTEKLYANAINGIGAMPPKGGRFNFSDDEIKAIVDYMIDELE
ncbi:c-type cytochrome [Vreelandella nanhaiensis]|uniref:Cytochrome c5 family protein n=1 Tax=Vreelandella nanhaiensis TaxID=1258546 RepID=A0A433KNL7_9GAMM|nr:c-type cytochrome [Halomonas nanhaiensis]RUR31137.1 cytochrome c5 family protein [Halomonas nanhaiensis]